MKKEIKYGRIELLLCDAKTLTSTTSVRVTLNKKQGNYSTYHAAITFETVYKWATGSTLSLTGKEITWLLKYKARVEMFEDIVNGLKCKTINPETAWYLFPEAKPLRGTK